MTIQIAGLIGLFLGLVSAGIGVIVGRRQAKKERAIDEVYEHIWQKARSYAWYVTLVVIYILLIIALLGVTFSVVMVLSLLLMVHLFSWGTIGAYLSLQIYGTTKADRQLYMFLLGFFIVLGIIFIVLTFYIF